MDKKKRIVIFASGSGSNAESIVNYFENKPVEVVLFLTNNAEAGIIKRGKRLGIPTLVFDKKSFSQSDRVVALLQSLNIDLVVLGGFLWLIPEKLIKAFPDRIINIHPALLPKYGGKGMWGHHVHEAVVANGETESGITIHLVNEHYDEGRALFQKSTPILPSDSPEEVAAKVLKIEHEYFPKVVEEYLGRI
ncbi:formyltetrahydrofolate-dependent phosphoribosylglycinamide formyltransferase [Spirosomataceae bacterium TFI 002]|nr:formyltetrahydrofolate-dependent phosphoribosylglycinamide formyltransferase [Spirosomataceae bacterium TFI 002]